MAVPLVLMMGCSRSARTSDWWQEVLKREITNKHIKLREEDENFVGMPMATPLERFECKYLDQDMKTNNLKTGLIALDHLSTLTIRGS